MPDEELWEKNLRELQESFEEQDRKDEKKKCLSRR